MALSSEIYVLSAAGRPSLLLIGASEISAATQALEDEGYIVTLSFRRERARMADQDLSDINEIHDLTPEELDANYPSSLNAVLTSYDPSRLDHVALLMERNPALLDVPRSMEAVTLAYSSNGNIVARPRVEGETLLSGKGPDIRPFLDIE